MSGAAVRQVPSVRPAARARLPATAHSLAHRLGRYSLVSIFNVVAGAAIVTIVFGFFGWSARSANLVATAVVTFPSYLLNRAWVWGRSGRSRMLGEVLPFWSMAFLGLVVSTLAVGYGEDLAARISGERAVQTAVVVACTIAAYGLVWLAKFAVLETLVFSAPVAVATPAGTRAPTEGADALA